MTHIFIILIYSLFHYVFYSSLTYYYIHY